MTHLALFTLAFVVISIRAIWDIILNEYYKQWWKELFQWNILWAILTLFIFFETLYFVIWAFLVYK